MEFKIKFIIPFIAVFSMIFTNSALFGAGSSDDDENYVEVVDANYINGKEQAYNGKFEEAFKYYNKALKLDPRHRGTHEYIGRLYLNLNQLEKAKMHLDKLDSICFFGCDEYSTLKKAIEDYENTKVVKNY